jgi:uncharacterized protein YdeI (YjbR/CyaY-like superfamily)
LNIKDGLEVVAFATTRGWEGWLERNHESKRGVWLKLAKKGSGVKSVSYSEAVEGALCYGWIDGLLSRFDEDFYLQRFTPRTNRSKWSQLNREHIARLTAEGRMRPAGLAAVEAAKADGRWDAAYAPPSRAVPPDDLVAELQRNPNAKAAFEALDAQNRYAIIHRLNDAKRPETRKRRLEKYVAMLEAGERLHP